MAVPSEVPRRLSSGGLEKLLRAFCHQSEMGLKLVQGSQETHSLVLTCGKSKRSRDASDSGS